jgi:DNA-directed RNA polymerase omega subunit
LTTQHELLDAAIKQVGNRYLTTMLVAKRIRQLLHGAPPYVERAEGESPFSVAMREVAEGRIMLEDIVPADRLEDDTPAEAAPPEETSEAASETPTQA